MPFGGSVLDFGRFGKCPLRARFKSEGGSRKADTSEATDGVKWAFGAYSEANYDFRLRTPTSFLGTGLSSVASDFTLGSFKV